MSKDTSNSKFKYIPQAVVIRTSLDNFPNVKFFLERLLQETTVKVNTVGKPFQYNFDVTKYKCFRNYGIFMDFFTRKHLSNRFNIEITDAYTEDILSYPEYYFSGKKKNLIASIKRHYEIYKDPKTKAMDIIPSIKIVSCSERIYSQKRLPSNDYGVDVNNLREIMKYFNKLPYSTVKLNTILDCDFFSLTADIIFDDDVIYDIRSSKYRSLTHNTREVSKTNFYQLVLCAFGFYKKFGIKCKTFKIYNTLLACEYVVALQNHIDFELFEGVLQRDVDAYNRLSTILEDDMVLDLSLFAQRNRSANIL